MKTEENNKLIAEFMGITGFAHPSTKGSGDMTFKTFMNPNSIKPLNELKFHSSWDWLMPVVEKIQEETFDNSFKIGNGWVAVKHYYSESLYSEKEQGSYERYYDIKKDVSTLDNAYKAVVEFIKWYNENDKRH